MYHYLHTQATRAEQVACRAAADAEEEAAAVQRDLQAEASEAVAEAAEAEQAEAPESGD
mgnify:CR=1 FL=1